MSEVEKTLRIALLTHSTNPRGGVVHALELGGALHDAGHAVTVHAPDPVGRGFFRVPRCDAALISAESVRGPLSILVRKRVDEYVAYFSGLGKRELARWDIFHAQDSISGNALAILAQQGKIPGFVRTVHHLDSFEDPDLMALQLRAFTRADRVLCVSGKWCEVLRREFGVAAEQVPNGVDLARFSSLADEADIQVRQHYGVHFGGPVLLAVGGVEERKNTLRVLQAFIEVRKELPHAQLVVVGGASLLDHDSYRTQFDAMVRSAGMSLGPGQSVVVTGSVPDAEMPALFRAADVLVFPSLREGFGLVVLEAMASGTPVVTSNIAPFTEYLCEDECVWANPLDVASIAAAVGRACEPGIAHHLRVAGRGVAARFGWSKTAQRHVEIYREMAGHSPSTAESGQRAHA